jgi:flagellum-specific peptidoglycan hydrolase FlgJ
MDKNTFVKTFFSEAKKASDLIYSQKGKVVFPATILTRAAIESGWGKHVVGNNFFGIKDFDGVNGNEILITTHEYHKTKNVKYPKVLSVVWDAVRKLFKYKVQDYFRKYNTASESFYDFCMFLVKNPRYSKAFDAKNAYDQGSTICFAGYATHPEAVKLTRQVTISIEKIITDLKLN